MVATDYLIGLLTAVITFSSLLLVLYSFVRELQYQFKDDEGVFNKEYEDLSLAIAGATTISFSASILLFIGLILSDPLSFSMEPTAPATLTGIGLMLFLVSVIIIFCAFLKLTDEEHR